MKEIDFEYLKELTEKLVTIPISDEELKEIDKILDEIALEEHGGH